MKLKDCAAMGSHQVLQLCGMCKIDSNRSAHLSPHVQSRSLCIESLGGVFQVVIQWLLFTTTYESCPHHS